MRVWLPEEWQPPAVDWVLRIGSEREEWLWASMDSGGTHGHD